jgi:hypothetical protein
MAKPRRPRETKEGTGLLVKGIKHQRNRLRKAQTDRRHTRPTTKEQPTPRESDLPMNQRPQEPWELRALLRFTSNKLWSNKTPFVKKRQCALRWVYHIGYFTIPGAKFRKE